MTPEREADLWAKIASMRAKIETQAYHQTRLQRSHEARKMDLELATARAERAEAALARVKAILDEPYDDEWDEADQATRARNLLNGEVSDD